MVEQVIPFLRNGNLRRRGLRPWGVAPIPHKGHAPWPITGALPPNPHPPGAFATWQKPLLEEHKQRLRRPVWGRRLMSRGAPYPRPQGQRTAVSLLPLTMPYALDYRLRVYRSC